MIWKLKRKPRPEKVDDHADRYLPELQRRRVRRRRKIWLGAAGIVLLLLLGFGLWLALYSPLFRISEVRVEGNRELSSKDILVFLHGKVSAGFWGSLAGYDNILVWPDSLSRAELASFPALEDISLDKDLWSRRVTVSVREREVFGVWCLSKEEPSRCFWFDQAGVILSRAPRVEGNLILWVNDYFQNDLTLDSYVLPLAEIPNAFSIFRVLGAVGLPVREIRLDDLSLSEMKVILDEGPDLYFSLRFPADGALTVLDSFKQKSADLAKIQYIDFRVENRAYYK